MGALKEEIGVSGGIQIRILNIARPVSFVGAIGASAGVV